MQAIVTKSLGPTERFGDRVKATAQAGSLTLENDDRLHIEENHKRAATALANKFGWLDWGTELVGGGTPDGNFCWVFATPQKSAAMGDWRDVVIDALQAHPDDLERSVRRAMTVIGHELNMTTFDSNPFTPFAKLGTWAVDEDFSVYIGDARFLLKGLPAFDLTAPDEGGNGGPRRASIDAEQRQGIVDAILVMLRGGQ